MRILFVMHMAYVPQAFRGARITVHEYCRRLQDRGHEVAVLGKLLNGDKVWALNRLKARLTGQHYPAGSELGYPVYRGWEPLNGVPEVIKRFAPDVVIARAGSRMPTVQKVLETGTPVVADLHTVEFGERSAPFLSGPEITYLSNSEFTARRLRERYGLDSTVIPPLVIPDKYRGCEGGGTVLHVNPQMNKGIDITLDLAAARPDIPFTVVEARPLSEEMRQARSRVESLPNVTWHKAERDMRKLYRKARLVIMPSRWEEAWGRVATEAHVSGIPLLASNRGGLPESVGPGGVLVDPDAGLTAWADALAKLWDDASYYEQVAAEAKRYANRSDIQPENLVSMFESTLRAHCDALWASLE